MPLSPQAQKERDDNLSAINHILYRVKKGEIVSGRDYMPPITIEPFIYITIYIDVGDPIEYHRKGYVVDIDTSTFRAIGAKYFVCEGKDTYTEVYLSTKQFRDLVQYYKINEMDLLAMCQKKLKE